MRINAIGETVLDIVLKNGTPLAANPGGSALNAIVSLSRLGMAARFITELGGDETGSQILSFLEQNAVITDSVAVYPEHKTAIALAHLDDKQNATYSFYKDFPTERLSIPLPSFTENDLLLFGSSFARNQAVRKPLFTLLKAASDAGSIIYYDPNYRSKQGETPPLDLLIENMRHSTIVRGSDEDFMHIFNHTDCAKIFETIASYALKMVICTHSDKRVDVFHGGSFHSFTVPSVNVKSTIGAGDNFNAGFLYGLARHGISRSMLDTLDLTTLQAICADAIACASHVCTILDNSISVDFAAQFRKESFGS